MAGKRDLTYNISVPVNVSGEGQIAKLEGQLRASREEVDRLRSSLQDAESEVSGLIEELSRIKSGSGLDIMEEELKRFKDTAEQSLSEFRAYLESVNLNDAWGNNDWQFENLFRQIKDGSMTAQQAIQKVKIEFDYLLQEIHKTSDGAFDSQMIQQFALSMENLANRMDEVLDRISRIESEGVKTVGDAVSGGGGGSIASISEIFNQVREAAEHMSEAANGSITSVSSLVGALKEYSEIDSTKLLGISQAFRNMADLGTGSFSSKAVENLIHLATQISALNQNGNFNFRFDVEGLKDFKVSTTIHHLSEFLESINEGQIANLERLSKVDLSKFHQDNLKISKATADSIKELMSQNEAMEASAKAAEADKAGMEAAAKAEAEKAKIADLLAKALAKEEEQTRKTGKASNEHAEDVAKMVDTLREIGKLMPLQEKLKIEDQDQYKEVTRQLEELKAKYDALREKTQGSLTDKEIAKLADLEEKTINKVLLARSNASDRVKQLNAKQMADRRKMEEKEAAAAEKEAQRKAEAEQKAAQKAAEAAEKEAQKKAEAEQKAAQKAAEAAEKEAQRKAEAERKAAEAAEKAAQRKAEAEQKAIKKAAEAARKAEQLTAYNDARGVVNKYYGLLTSKDTNAARRQDVTLGANGWESASGVYSPLADQLNAATTAYNMLTDAQHKNNMSAQQVAAINKLIADQSQKYALAVSNEIAKEQERAQKEEAAARAKEQQAESARKAAEAKRQEAEATARAAAVASQANAQLKATRQQESEAAKETNASYQKMLNILKDIGKYRLEKQKAAAAGKDPNVENAEKQLKELIARYRELKQELNGKLNTSQLQAVTAEIIKQKRDLQNLLSNQASNDALSDSKALDGAAQSFDKVKSAADGLRVKTEEVNKAITDLEVKLRAAQSTPAGSDARKRAMEEYRASLEAATKAVKAQADEEKKQEKLNGRKTDMLKQLNQMLVQCENEQRKYAAAAKLGVAKDDYKQIQENSRAIAELADKIRNATNVTPEMAAKFDDLKLKVSNTSTAIKTNSNLIGRWATTGMDQLKSRLSYSIGLAAMVYKAANEIKKMISTAVELDTAMNQLQIVTRSSSADMDNYAKRVAAMAKETGQATKDLIDATTVYARLGYSMDESATLSKYTAMLQGVGDIDASAAQDAMTAIIKAFDKNVNDVEDVMNKMVVVGNNFPISVSQIAEGMNNAGSMMAVAGNSLEESIALLTAANTTVQDISKASTGLRTIAARIRKTTTEEDGDEAINEAKYEEMLGILTKHKVTLTTINGEYKSTYKVVKDIAGVWEQLTSMEKAAVTEALAGTRQQNVFASLITQFQEAEQAIDRMQDSAGELQEAYDIRMSSIEAHVNTMKAAFAELSRDVVDSDLAKGVVDILTKIIESLDILVNDIGVLGVALTALGSSVVFKAITSGSLAAGFSGIAKAITLVKMAAPELLLVAAAVAAITLAVKKYKEAHPSFDDLKQSASTAKSEAEAAAQEYQKVSDAIEENKDKLKELQKLAANGKITRSQQDEIDKLTEQNEKYSEQLGILERKAQLAKEAADAAQREAANAKFDEMFSDAQPKSKSYLFGGWDRAGGDAKVVLGGRVPETVNAKEKADELIGAYEYAMLEAGRISDAFNERLESDSEEVKKSADELIDDLDIAEGKLKDTRKALVDYANDLYALRDMYEGLNDEDSLARVAEIDELLDKISKSLPKTDKSLASFKNNLKLLDSTIKNKLAKDINSLTNDELRKFQQWLKDCGYSVDDFKNLLQDLSDEMHAGNQPENTYVGHQISQWGTMTEEIQKAQAALEDYKKAMEGGNNDELAKQTQEAWKAAMEDIESGRIDSKAVWAFAELAMSPQQLAALSYDAERIANVIKSSFYRSLFDDDNTENGFSDEDNKYGYGQRLLKMLEERQGELPGVKVWRDAAGGVQYTIDDFDELAKHLDISSELLYSLLHDLDAYGKELLTDTKQNTELVESLKYYTNNITDAKEATKQFIEEAFKYDENLSDSTMWRILNGLHDQGHLKLDPSEYYDLIQEVRTDLEEESEKAEEDLTLQPRADDTLLMEDIDDMLDNCQKHLDEKVLQVHLEADSDDAKETAGNVDNSPEAVEARNEELRKQLEEDAALYEEKIKNLYATLGDLADETGSVRGAVKLLVDQLRGIGMSDDEIEGILESFRGMGLAIMPTLEDLDAEAAELQGTLNGLDETDARPQVDLNTSAAYRALNSIVSELNNVTQRTWTVNLGMGVYGTASKITDAGKTARSRAAGGVTGKAGPTLVNELGPELISDRGRAFIANNGQPGFVNLSKDAIVFNAEDTRRITRNGRGSLINRLVGGKHTGAYASGSYWVCPKCGYHVPSTQGYCPYCRTTKPSSTAASTSSKVSAGATKVSATSTSTSSGKSAIISSTTGKSVSTSSSTWWYCSNCGRANPSSSSRCESCGTSRYNATSAAVLNGINIGKSLTASGGKAAKSGLYQSVQSANYDELFNVGGGDGGGGGGGVGGADSQSRSNPQKIDWIAVKLNRIQRAISDLEKVASSGLKKLSTRLTAAKDEASKLNEEIDIAQRGYDRYIQEAESVGLSASLAEKVRNGAIDINEYDDEELRQQIQEYQEWYEKALECKSAVEELNQQIGELYKTNFDLVQQDYANQLGLIEHEMNMINADMAMAQAKGMLDSAAYYERLMAQQTTSVGKMKNELADLEKYFNEAMASGKIEEGSEEWYAMRNAINETKEAIAGANVQLQEYANTIRDIKWSYFDYAQDQFGMLADEANFLIELMSNDKLFKDNGQFNNTGFATLGMRAVNYDAYMAQADEYAKEMRKIESELASDPYNKDLINRRNTLLQLQRQSITAAEQEKNAVKSLVQEGIQLELDSLRKLIDAYKDSLDSAKDLYEYQKKISEKTQSIASIQKQLAAYQGDTSEETRAKVQKLNKDLEKAQADLAETERDKEISDQKKLLDDVYNEYEELLNARLDDVDLLMKEMIGAANENAATIRNEINAVAGKVGYDITDELRTAMNGHYANYDRIFEGVTGVTTVLNRIYDNVNAMARAAGAVKAYAKGGLVDYTGLAAVHGTPGNPELVLSAADTEKFLQAAQMMQSMQNLAPISAKDLGVMMAGSGSAIGDITMNIEIERVLDYNDFVTQLQADPKFEKLIDTMTMSRMLGGSKLAKGNIHF